ncbi:tripartite ATP-independent transporter DctM subunit [Rhodothalassium salexigens DSM 2132]|uniref:Tripartite ATP-independent transporter DctM subunit n=1 Tax=Rhodothalassium salexigens DSM 2132 TaxID=1188247 RepID=A0A4R2PPZ6_RHOSA|nr:TRAP transporter large permease subunit [Rhodothalassium salexigens]MBB4210590.1 TRAP-type mannitol/chloroaromatic compound transport system permease large subunit [Rhodothalassium salexigens DSM 2132]MBK1639726.1 tripartite transporter [Rhodothalassium salexigens DSM 2132]TCP37853.1 tripartite ATP-independent transporter DctM subunit [Rhodothalassium salexigens DSM 2132]
MALSTLLLMLLVVALFAWLMTGFPVAFTLAGTALVFGAIGLASGVLEPGFIDLFPNRIYGIVRNELLLAVPMFIAMGTMLERSKVAEDLLESMGRLFGSLRGGLGLSVTLVGALLAASTGIVGATVVTMGLLSLPTMLKRGYDPRLAAGSITAAGTLGQIIPPSIVLILLTDQLNGAYQSAQRELNVLSPEPLSVGALFAGALVPGLGLVALYMLYQVAMAVLRPASSPALPPVVGEAADARFMAMVGPLLRALLPPVVLIVAVLGSILAGVATPTEAAAVGAVGAILLGGLRSGSDAADTDTDADTETDTGPRAAWTLRAVRWGLGALVVLLALPFAVDLRQGLADPGPLSLVAFSAALVLTAVFVVGLAAALWRTFRTGVLGEVLRSTVRISTMIYTILIGAALFSLVFRGFGGDALIEQALSGLPGGPAAAVVVVMLVMFCLGFFLDFIEITFIVVPIVAPVLFLMGVDPVWLGVMMAINLQTSFLTPPFGFALFYLRGVAPDQVATRDIYLGAVPFVAIQVAALALLALVPDLATALPDLLAR